MKNFVLNSTIEALESFEKKKSKHTEVVQLHYWNPRIMIMYELKGLY